MQGYGWHKRNIYPFCFRIGRVQAVPASPECIRNEGEFFDAICSGDIKTLSRFRDDTTRTSSFTGDNWDFVKRCAKAVAFSGNIDVLKVVINTFVGESAKPPEIAEIFALETIASGRSAMVTGLLQHWAVTRNPLVSWVGNTYMRW